MDVRRVELLSNRTVYNQTYLAASWGKMSASTRVASFPLQVRPVLPSLHSVFPESQSYWFWLDSGQGLLGEKRLDLGNAVIDVVRGSDVVACI